MADFGAVINRIFTSAYAGSQSSARTLSLEGRITGSTYMSAAGRTSTYSNGIIQVSQTSVDVSGIDADPAAKNSVRNGINLVRQQTFTGVQTSNRVSSLDGTPSNSVYVLNIGDVSTNNGISAVSPSSIDVSGIDSDPAAKSSVSNGISTVRQQSFAGLQTSSRVLSMDGSANNAVYVLNVGETSTVNGISSASSTRTPGDDEPAQLTNERMFYITHLSTSLGTAVKYYTMWGLDNTSTPRSWVVKNEPDTTGGQSGFNMATGSIRIINTWVT